MCLLRQKLCAFLFFARSQNANAESSAGLGQTSISSGAGGMVPCFMTKKDTVQNYTWWCAPNNIWKTYTLFLNTGFFVCKQFLKDKKLVRLTGASLFLSWSWVWWPRVHVFSSFVNILWFSVICGFGFLNCFVLML